LEIGSSILLYITGNRIASLIGGIGLAWLGAAVALPAAALAADAAASAKPAPIKIAVFDFELEDVSPAASQAGASGDTAAIMQKVSNEARRLLVQSGRYTLVDVSKSDAKPVIEKTLRDCDGCEAGIALQLGADQAMVGVIRRATMTDYYVLIQVSDCHSGRVLDQQAVNFAGGDDGWASGVGMVIRHTVLASDNQP
jgi:Protein of unknown function (DUF2380)